MYVHKVLVNRLGSLSLPRKSVVRLTDHPDMTLDVYRGLKQHNNNNNIFLAILSTIGLKQTTNKYMRHLKLPSDLWYRFIISVLAVPNL